MEIFHGYAGSRKLSPCSSFQYAPSISLGSIFTHTFYGVQFKQATIQAKYQLLAVKKVHHACISAFYFPNGHHGWTLHLVIDELPSKVHHSQFSVLSSSGQIESEKILANEDYEVHDLDVRLCNRADNTGSSKRTSSIRDKEMQRTRKIGQANKGRIPWNKGRTHSEETRERISKRTIEGLSDPKVMSCNKEGAPQGLTFPCSLQARKKMSEYPHSHSDQSKVRIGSALRKIWEKRLRQRRLQENCYLMWARSIAVATKEGCPGQDELEWDSYERMMSDIISQHLERKADRARAKEIAKLRAEEATNIRAEKAARRAQLRKEKEEKAKAREAKALARKKSEDVKLKMALSKGLKLKARITKFKQHKRSLGNYASIKREIAVEPQPIVDNLDIDLIKIEKMRRTVSLADQIQAVKNRKGEFNVNNFLATAFPFSSSEVEAGGS